MQQPILYPDDVIRLLVAFGLGGMLGFEREFHHKFAGLRTIILICVGAALFTIFSLKIGARPRADRGASGHGRRVHRRGRDHPRGR